MAKTGFSGRLLSRLIRNLAYGYFRCINPGIRAQIYNDLEDQLISVININGDKIKFCTQSPILLSRANSLLTKEPDTIAWIDSFKDNEIFWDVGANVGVYSLYAAVRTPVTVIAFEPSAANFYVLAKNIQINGLSGQVSAYSLAFADATKTGILNMSSPAKGAAIQQFGKPGEMSRYWNRHSTPVTQNAVGYSIDDFIRGFNPAFPNHLKIDVDGLELPILNGAMQTLCDQRLRSIMVEICVSHSGEESEVYNLLEKCGLYFISKGEPQQSGGEQGVNHLFKRRK